VGQDGVAVFLLDNPQAGMEMHVHSERLRDRMGLIDPACPETSHVEFLKRDHIRLISRDDIRDP
jgi:hypothetical protein